uniref:Uncharacterized protein n=1 Tax=Ciona savignyi TaxID=51511 RepID=H2YEF6_CIOSA
MREFSDEVDSNGRQTKGPFNVYGGRNAYIIPPICLLLSFGLWWGVAKLATSILKKVMVSPDRKVLTFVTYRLIGKENVISVPVGSANLKGQGQIIINIQGLNKKHFLTSEGVITNQALFRSVLGVYRDPKLDL